MIRTGFVLWFGSAIVCGWLAGHKGYPPRYGVISGLFGGPFALVIFALLPTTELGRENQTIDRQIYEENIHQHRLKRCPDCGRDVGFATRVCPRCEHRFTSTEIPPQRDKIG